jgi:hypothetical protein
MDVHHLYTQLSHLGQHIFVMSHQLGLVLERSSDTKEDQRQFQTEVRSQLSSMSERMTRLEAKMAPSKPEVSKREKLTKEVLTWFLLPMFTLIVTGQVGPAVELINSLTQLIQAWKRH